MTPAALSALHKGETANFIAATTPGGIEAQERAGQIEESFNETLPIIGTSSCRPTWEALGFVFGEPADDIFVNATFPKGWRKRPTDHAMWSELLDEQGRCRAAIFYKAAFYDRHAHVSFTCRYSFSAHEEDGPRHYKTVVLDAGTVIHTIGRRDKDTPSTDHREDAISWLNSNFPEWESPAAYWEQSGK